MIFTRLQGCPRRRTRSDTGRRGRFGLAGRLDLNIIENAQSESKQKSISGWQMSSFASEKGVAFQVRLFLFPCLRCGLVAGEGSLDCVR